MRFLFFFSELNSKYLSSLGKSECIQELKESSGVAEIDFTIFIFNILMYFPVVMKTPDALFFESWAKSCQSVFEEEDYTFTIYYLRVCICSFLELCSVFPVHVTRHLLQLVVSICWNFYPLSTRKPFETCQYFGISVQVPKNIAFC